MKLIKALFKTLLVIISIPILYFIIAITLSWIDVDRINTFKREKTHTIYLHTNGVHLDIVLEKSDIPKLLSQGVYYQKEENYFSFGWGDKNFYLNTPNWSDLTLKNTVNAMFLESETLIHVTRHKEKKDDWKAIKIDETELNKLKTYLSNSFKKEKNGRLELIENTSYALNDNFYEAKGSYSILKTCNTWVNNAFKNCGLKACYWTPFDFGLLNKY